MKPGVFVNHFKYSSMQIQVILIPTVEKNTEKGGKPAQKKWIIKNVNPTPLMNFFEIVLLPLEAGRFYQS